MPRTGVALFARPLFDKATSYAHYFMDLAAGYAAGNMLVIDLDGSGATKANIFAALEGEDPIFCYLNGHSVGGSPLGGGVTSSLKEASIVIASLSMRKVWGFADPASCPL
ncbi:unnamed protein product [marine sediment metagenome]|uniref:Uncharacterized protein n=1 Tax=marine sediment metagenome TaxID=412755 RepID=X1C2J3_9ZZZZ